MKKIIIAGILALTIIGCDSSSSGSRNTAPVEPEKEVIYVEVPAEIPMEEAYTIPTSGIGSIKGDMDCNGGTITTNYSFGNVNEDDKSFVIQYARNGALEDLTYPSTSNNGSRATVKDIYYIRQNDDDRDASWIVTISYQSPNETYNLVTTTLRQPQCEDNATALITKYEVK